ncbi:MAG: monovalent cation/H(+) antiporter subunit G [Gemmatimonadota bacterium]
MELVIDGLSWFFLLTGAFFMLVSGIGILRMPDVFTRAHAAGVKDTLGAALTLVGLMLQAGFTLVAAKLLLIWIFLWFTAPVASHAVARAALLGGVRPILVKHGAAAGAENDQAARAAVKEGEDKAR